MKLLLCACALTAASLLGAASAHAATQRFALVVANNDGGEGLAPLRYAGRDAGRLADVLVDLGGFARADILSVVDGEAGVVLGLMDEMERRLASAKGRGDDVIFVFYYSGHAQNGTLRMGRTQLEMNEVRRRLEQSAADVRLAFVDSCGAGHMTREKGATLAPPFVVKVDEGLSARGQVIITSSSADEVSQESDEIQGSFFTHYLATGLRGDADRDDDGRVTLDEAYAYAYGRTVAATASTRAGAQHPTYAYDLHGAGDVILTQPRSADVFVDFPAELEGRYFVVDLERQLFVAEVDKSRGQGSRIALPAGDYAVKKRTDKNVLITRLGARAKGTFVIDEAQMQTVSFADDYAKGTPLLSADAEDAVGWSFSLGAGGQVVFDSVDNGNLFPAIPLLVLEARARDFLREDLVLSLDVGGGTIAATRTVDGGFGELVFATQYTQLQGGASLLWQPLIFDSPVGTFEPLIGPRVAGLWIQSAFQGEDAPLPSQYFVTFTPGVVAVLGWRFWESAHVEVVARAHYLPYTVDGLRNLAVVEGLASVWVDF